MDEILLRYILTPNSRLFPSPEMNGETESLIVRLPKKSRPYQLWLQNKNGLAYESIGVQGGKRVERVPGIQVGERYGEEWGKILESLKECSERR